MITTFTDPFDALLSLQRELESRLASDWLEDTTTSRGPFPPINVFQQGDDILALMEVPGIDKNELQIQAKANTIRVSGKKRVDYSNDVSVHRRERVSGDFDRTLSLPVQVDPDRIKAEYRDGLLAVLAESRKGQTAQHRDQVTNLPSTISGGRLCLRDRNCKYSRNARSRTRTSQRFPPACSCRRRTSTRPTMH